MTLATSLLTLSALLPLPQGGLKLPTPTPTPGTTQNVPRPLSEVEKFRRDLGELAAAPSRTELKLQEMGLQYPEINALIIEVARSARSKEMGHLMTVARRFGNEQVAQELRFQVLARPLGSATRPVVDAMVHLMGPERDPDDALDERQALRDCIRGRITSARRPATEALAEIATVDDLPFALELTSDQSLDLQLRGVDLLKAIDDDAARARLVKLLSKGPALAGAVCQTLIALRERVAPDLQTVMAEPPIDRGYSYAAFALAEIGELSGQRLLDPNHTENLNRGLRDREALTRSLSAIALADLAYYTPPGAVAADAASAAIDDAAVGDALLVLVDSRQFVPNLDLLRGPAEQRLVRMTGRVVTGGEALSWQQWWQAQREGFVGIRAAVAVNAANAENTVVTLRTERQVVRLLAEGLADVPPLADAQEVLLTKAEMLTLVQSLERQGFGDVELMRHGTALPPVRSLEVQVEGARALVGMPALEHRPFEGLVQRIEVAVENQLWQLYRNPRDEPDRAAFWRAERRWLDSHPDATERGRRVGRRVIANWEVLTPWLRGRALEHLFARADRKDLFDEADGERIVALVIAAPALGATEQGLLELAAGVPGDRIWRECVDAAARVQGGGRDAVRAVFAVLGPEKVLAALGDERPIVRRVAIEEAMLTRDLRAGPRLVELLQGKDEPDDVRRAAAIAAGQLRLASAQDPLVALIAAEDTAPEVRRECLHALGRTGGTQAFAVLDQALRAPVPEDREAALRGLGELKDPRSAHTLAELAVIAHGKDIGNLARLYLGRMGASLAVPALRLQAQTVQDPAIRDQLVLLLGGYQDPQAIPDLMELLRTPQHRSAATDALMGTTGLALAGEDDVYGIVDDWYRKHRAEPQWRWLLDALAGVDVATLLRPEQFEGGSGGEAVPELARLLAELSEPRLFVLTAAVLRNVSKQDYGVVSMQTPQAARAGIAARYRLAFEGDKAAKNR